MAQFLTTTEVYAQIQQIIRDATSKLVLISPFLKLPDILFERLREADRKKIGITIIYGQHELEYDQTKLLTELNNLSLHYYEHLHAKCYFNETRLVITSMNLYQFSAQNNREMGVLILKDQDREVFENARVEAKSILDSSSEVNLEKQVSKQPPIHEPRDKTRAKSSYGFCIRCGGKIKYDREKPLCEDCYGKWAQYENPEYVEKYCHRCHKPYNTSKLNPLCGSCFWEARER